MLILHSNKYTAPNVHIRTNEHTNQKVLKNKPQIHRQDGKVYFVLRTDLDNAKHYCQRPLVSYKGNWPRLAFFWARVKEITND